jgi:hypothetical protein
VAGRGLGWCFIQEMAGASRGRGARCLAATRGVSVQQEGDKDMSCGCAR